MCGRYYIQAEDSAEEIRELLNEIASRENAPAFKTGEIFPTDSAPVIVNNRVFVPRPFVMRWGFEMKNTSLLINARSETVSEKALFKDLYRERRALIPASGYYEWEKAGSERVKYSISNPEKCIFMAGLYRPRTDGNGHEFVILTRDAAPGIRFIHQRMPVLFALDSAGAWLSRNTDPDAVLKRAQTEVFFESMQAQLRLI